MRQIDNKYKTSGDVTKTDGAPIPDDEPLFLFRGKDKLLPELLNKYLELCQNAGSPPTQLDSLREEIDEIRAWQAAHSDRLKVPD